MVDSRLPSGFLPPAVDDPSPLRVSRTDAAGRTLEVCVALDAAGRWRVDVILLRAGPNEGAPLVADDPGPTWIEIERTGSDRNTRCCVQG